MEKMTSLLRLRMSAKDAHYGGNLVDGAHMVHLFGDVATELLIKCDGDEGLFCAYDNVEFLAPVYAGDYIEAYGEIEKIGNTSRTMRFEARKVVVCHIGSGASLCAIEDGVCRDTTMGLTPLDGLMMGTRCGSIDPATVCYLQREGGYTFDEVDEMMNKKSGLLAVTGGKTNDCRNVEELAAAGDPEAQLAFDMFVYKIAAKAAEMATSMCGMDTLVFTAGIGENDWSIRKAFCDCFEWLGVRIDNNKNREAVGNGPQVISAAGSSVTVMVIPTDEEYMIAHDVERLTKNN